MPSSLRIQRVTPAEMAALASENSIFSKIEQGVLRAEEEAQALARIPGGGYSFFISYYEGVRYVCTVHKIVTNEGKIYHYHLKRLCTKDIDYRLAE